MNRVNSQAHQFKTFHEIAAIYAFGQLKESPLIQFCPIHLWGCGMAILLGSLVSSQMVWMEEIKVEAYAAIQAIFCRPGQCL